MGKRTKLVYNLSNLSDNGILPPILDGIADIIRNLGNTAAHPEDTEFSNEMVSSMMEFTQTL
ncbi:DUF4145 domain-containing protein [Aneurinibacillus tyrosinisolvens]|uniref:DUF4145 domain-containing protein n=1 Tax=Aneurinibacillus tyrosinisolvens TaxID=1443435 RepID=UPI0034E1F181